MSDTDTHAGWLPISTAPKDGTWFLICNKADGWDSYEVGCYDPLKHAQYTLVDDNLYKRTDVVSYDWRGFNNFHRATHWRPLPNPPGDR